MIIELFWSKKRILEIYLNITEYAPGIYGVEAASWHFFNKSATSLDRNEAIYMAALLPAPNYFHKNMQSRRLISNRLRIYKWMDRIRPLNK